MELRLELLAMCCILNSHAFGNPLLTFGGDAVSLGLEPHSVGVPLLTFGGDAVSLGLEPHTFGNPLLTFGRDAVSLGLEPHTFGNPLLTFGGDAVSLGLEPQSLGLLADPGEFCLSFDPRRLFLNERHRLFQPTVIFGCRRHVDRCTDHCDRAPIVPTQRCHRHQHCDDLPRARTTCRADGSTRRLPLICVSIEVVVEHARRASDERIEAMTQGFVCC